MPTLKVKTLSAHLNGQTLSTHLTCKNSKYPHQKSQPKLPTLKVKTSSAHLNGQNAKCPPQRLKP